MKVLTRPREVASATEIAVRAKDAAAAGTLPHKTFDVQFKAFDEDGSFTMLAAVFGNVDRGGDVIDPGAIDNIAEFLKDGWIALNHDNRSLPVAYPTAASQSSEGLLVSGQFHSTSLAQETRIVARERKAAGKSVKASIGYRTTDESYEKVDGRPVRRLKKISIYEVSFVNLPMNPLAEVSEVKSMSSPSEELPMHDPPAENKRGVAISAANHKMLKAHLDGMAEHHEKWGAACKSMLKMHKEMAEKIGEMKTFIKGFAPASETVDDDDEEDAEDLESVTSRDKKKPAKSLTPDERSEAILRDQLRQRSMKGRGVQPCP